jgi:hypothetical protein
MTLNSKHLELEGTNIKLIWGTPIEQLHSDFGTGKQEKGDRTIYEWGEHTILNGLALNLTSMFWNFQEEPNERRLRKQDFWAVGDKPATDWFGRISEHLRTNFGEPTEKNEENLPDRIWTWNIEGLTLTLNFFEQHAYKLCFSIRKTE